jgi:ATP-dependent helicase/nuclease subunit A
MSDPQIIAMPLPDAGARQQIQEDLEVNLLVEAGAGSGKTTELVTRMVALVATGTTTVEHIAAVTFTRKAAAELRERFQARLEAELRKTAEVLGEEERGRIRSALEQIDRAFLGTIHSFCSRLLRERPLEVGLDPAFEELPVEERLRFRRRFWESYLERLARESDPILEELSEAGLRPVQLFGLFDRLVENPDVDFPAEEPKPPTAAEMAPIRRELETLVRRAGELMVSREPEKGWDPLQRKLRTAGFTLEVTEWRRPADFFDALTLVCKQGATGHKVTQNRWREPAMAKDLEGRVNTFGVGDTPARRLLDRWLAHRYALAIRLVSAAAEDFAEHRRRVGRLDFQDLLLLTARMLRENDVAREELGRRYRYLLVDEFQDTDPLQAEIMLLLSSDPPSRLEDEGEVGNGGPAGAGEDDEVADWRTAVPRPGALFVVGDPKQSIYRFRRADIQLYELVKRRFAVFGRVLGLNANFRSRPPIGDLVNEVFSGPDFFPPEATTEQASFEPLNTRPSDGQGAGEGVFYYTVHPDRDAYSSVAEDDAARLATWIRDRIDSGNRSPGDFLVLTRLTRSLASYARAMEAQSLPVQVTGAGVGVEEELRELLLLLECMVDPTDPVKVVTVLVGLFFGLDYESLVAHRLEGGGFDVIRPGRKGVPEVVEALGRLNAWWHSASREPADVFLGRVVPELGLLPFAAAGELGSLRGGALVYALDAVRAAVLAGDASLPGALEALRSALELREAEAPLEPGRPDVVRLMNLHQAKGLEAPVVILADPSKTSQRPPETHVERQEDGSARGYLRVAQSNEGFKRAHLLARPSGWEEKAEAESHFESAEAVRLLYVAVTRARDELVVARWPAKPEGSAWSALDPWLLERAEELVLEARVPPPREVLQLSPEEVGSRRDAAARRLRELAVPSFRHVSVTEVAKGGVADPAERDESSELPAPGSFRGYSWGSAVHGALAGAATDDSEAGLRSLCRTLLVENGRPLDDHGAPVELEELVALVRSVRGSELWQRAGRASRVFVEVPFAVPGITRPPARAAWEDDEGSDDGGASAQKQLDLFGGLIEPAEHPEEPPVEDEEEDPVPAVLEGVIDLAFREKGGWVIVDYKTDIGTDPGFPARVRSYRRQVDLYADAWARLTGESVRERVLYFTSQGRVEAW